MLGWDLLTVCPVVKSQWYLDRCSTETQFQSLKLYAILKGFSSFARSSWDIHSLESSLSVIARNALLCHFTNIMFCCKRKVRLLNSIASLSCQNPPEQNLMTNSSSYCIWKRGRQTVIETGSCGVQGTFLWGKHQGCFCSWGSRRAHLWMPAARHTSLGRQKGSEGQEQPGTHPPGLRGREGSASNNPQCSHILLHWETQKEVALKHQGCVSL